MDFTLNILLTATDVHMNEGNSDGWVYSICYKLYVLCSLNQNFFLISIAITNVLLPPGTTT